jgi:hypothetical protein
MSNDIKLLAFIAIAIAAGWGMTACQQEEKYEEAELWSGGQLTIYGLDDYEGREIYAYNHIPPYVWDAEAQDVIMKDDQLGAYANEVRAYEVMKIIFINGKFDHYECIPARVTSGSVILKVYVHQGIFISSTNMYDKGNRENEHLNVYLKEDTQNPVGHIRVDFIKGIGEADFIPVDIE